MITMFKYLEGGLKEGSNRLFTVAARELQGTGQNTNGLK